MTGIFVPWNDGPLSPGWMENGSGCHIWIGSRSRDGYGKVFRTTGTTLVHRLRYEAEIGPVPEGMVLDHYVCDNGSEGCCNPRHCRPVAARENVLRSNGLGSTNLAKTHCPQGHPLVEGNLVRYLRKSGQRSCLTCKRERNREYMRERAVRARQ